MSKPRELKLAFDEYGELMGDEQSLSSVDGLELIHVIEYNAYADIKKDLDRMTKWNDEQADLCQQNIVKLERERAAAAGLVEFMLKLTSLNPFQKIEIIKALADYEAAIKDGSK